MTSSTESLTKTGTTAILIERMDTVDYRILTVFERLDSTAFWTYTEIAVACFAAFALGVLFGAWLKGK